MKTAWKVKELSWAVSLGSLSDEEPKTKAEPVADGFVLGVVDDRSAAGECDACSAARLSSSDRPSTRAVVDTMLGVAINNSKRLVKKKEEWLEG